LCILTSLRIPWSILRRQTPHFWGNSVTAGDIVSSQALVLELQLLPGGPPSTSVRSSTMLGDFLMSHGPTAALGDGGEGWAATLGGHKMRQPLARIWRWSPQSPLEFFLFVISLHYLNQTISVLSYISYDTITFPLRLHYKLWTKQYLNGKCKYD
jgi:hypothetical protein